MTLAINLGETGSFAQWPMPILEWERRKPDPAVLVADDAGDYLVKPFKPADLLRRLRWLMLTNGF